MNKRYDCVSVYMCYHYILLLSENTWKKKLINIFKKITKNQKPKVSDYFSSVIYVIMVFHNSYDFQNFYLIYLKFCLWNNEQSLF